MTAAAAANNPALLKNESRERLKIKFRNFFAKNHESRVMMNENVF